MLPAEQRFSMSARKILAPEDRTFYRREAIARLLTPEYIRGLFEGEGSFTNDRRRDGTRTPAVALRMHYRDKELLEGIRDYFGIQNRVYEYTYNGRHQAMLIIREMPTLKNIIVPFFKNQLLGNKGMQFELWLKTFPCLHGLHLRNLPEKQPPVEAVKAQA